MPPRTLTSAQSLATRAAAALPAAALFSLLVLALPAFPVPATAQTHEELIELFDEWRAFERPVFADGVPDYSRDAMSRQHGRLEGWPDRLRELDASRWSVAQQIGRKE